MTSTPTNLVVQWARDHGASWIQDLVDAYHIKANIDGDRVSLAYDQIESPMDELIVQQCRGMVLTLDGTVLAWPYSKFWNHNESRAAPIHWETARVQEKLDGSLTLLFHTDGAWWVASSGHPTAGGSYGVGGLVTFRDMFWEIFTSTGMQLPPPALQDVTFLFELCSPSNRIVVTYERPMLVCHGARFRTTGVELSREVLEAVCTASQWPIVTQYPITSLEEALVKVAELDPIQTEGYVVVDVHHNRVKIKSPRYVVLHHMRGQSTTRRAIELFQTGEVGEVLSYFPEFSTVFLPVLERFDEIASRIQADWRAHGGAGDRKTFALAVKDRAWASILFKMFGKGNGTPDRQVAAERRAEPTGSKAEIQALLRSSSLVLLEELAAMDLASVPVPTAGADKAE